MIDDEFQQNRQGLLNLICLHPIEKPALGESFLDKLGSLHQSVRIAFPNFQLDYPLILGRMMFDHVARIGQNGIVVGQRPGHVRFNGQSAQGRHQDPAGQDHHRSGDGKIKCQSLFRHAFDTLLGLRMTPKIASGWAAV